MNTKILTTHVGSLPRSKALSELLFAKDKGDSFSENEFDDVVKQNVSDIVKKQLDTGIDFVSDGEMSKISYATYVKDRINGFSGESERRAPADLDAFPEYKDKIAKSGGTPTYTRPCCTGELSIKNNDDLLKDINNLSSALSANNHTKGFMNAASPGVINVFLPNKFYKNDDEYLSKLSVIMAEEYQQITSNNLFLQVDCPDLALARHMNFKELDEKSFLLRAEKQIEALNLSLASVPQHKIRMHICWGNYEGPHTFDIGLEKILPIVLKAKSKYLLIESSNPRHAHEWKIFDDLKSKIPETKILIPGVVDSTSNFVEHPDLICQRLENFINIVGKERLIAGSDCGFGTFAGYGNVDEDIVFEKLKSMVAAAKKF